MHVCVATGVATGGLCRPAHLNSTEIKFNSFFLRCVRWGGGGGGCLGFQRGGGVMWVQGSHSLGEKAVEQSGGAGSDTPGTVYLRVGAGRDCGRGWVGSSTILFALLEHRVRKMSRMEGRGHQWFLQRCSLSAGGSCGLLHSSFRTRQWCSWSARSQWYPCRRWWGWVEGGLLFSAGGEIFSASNLTDFEQ